MGDSLTEQSESSERIVVQKSERPSESVTTQSTTQFLNQLEDSQVSQLIDTKPAQQENRHVSIVDYLKQ